MSSTENRTVMNGIRSFSLALLLPWIMVATATGQVCNPDFIYVTTTGNASGTGTISDPVTFDRAITLRGSAPARNVILLQSGSYTLSGIKTIPANTVLDGRYTINGGEWMKSSGLTTTLSISGGYVTNGTGVGGYVAVSIGGNDVYIKDLNITNTAVAGTSTTNSRGRSTYGIHGNSVSNLYVSRSTIISGAASNGANGAAGANGVSGSPGVKGHPGDDDDHNNCDDGSEANRGTGGTGGGGAAGGPGAQQCDNTYGGNGAAGAGRNGGGGGGGSSGGRDDGTGSGRAGGNGGSSGGAGGVGGAASNSDNDCNRFHGNNGGLGGLGTNGVSQTTTEPSNYSFGVYFVPGGQEISGTDARGGGGGGGGGGGSRQSGTFCNDGSGNGGGGGGGGGQGGALGTGGFGGGGSFAVYFNGGSLKNLLNTALTAGTRGNGGNGGNGGSGGSGGAGNIGGDTDSDEVGRGGNGANGGAGGTGGRGMRGSRGVSQGSQGVTTHSGTAVTNTYTVTAKMRGMCTNSLYTLTKSSGTWDNFGQNYDQHLTASSGYVASNGTVEVYFTSTGHQDVSVSSVNYPNFLNIVFTRSAPTINPILNTCVGGSTTISTPTSGADYHWIVYSSNTGSPVATSSAQSFNWTPTSSGTFYVRLRVYDNCCGWSRSVHSAAITVNAIPNAGYTTWIGGTNNDWHTTSNWHCYLIPTASDNVIIPNGTPYTPRIFPSTTGDVRTIEVQGLLSELLRIDGDLDIHGP